MNEKSGRDITETIDCLKDVKILLTIMTLNFIQDSICKQIFMYGKKQLEINTKLILLTRNYNWKRDEDIGILCADEVILVR